MHDLFALGNHVFFGGFQWRHNYSVANTVLYLRACQHFHNKPLFSGVQNIARDRERHTHGGTERERNPSEIKARRVYLIFNSNLYLYLQPHILLGSHGGASAGPGISGLCPAGRQLSGRTFPGSGSMLGGWLAPFPDPSPLPSCISALRKEKDFLSLLLVYLLVCFS